MECKRPTAKYIRSYADTDRFLWVIFQLQDLCEATSDHAIRHTLNNLPEGLYETYQRKVAKIEAGKTSTLVVRTFQWITAAVRPLSLQEIQEAVAFDQDDTCWSMDKLPHPDKIIGSCQNLVILHEDGKICFAHHTVRSFLLSKKPRSLRSSLSFDLETANIHAAVVCVAYLCFADFETQIAHRPQDIVQRTGGISSGGLIHLTRALGISDLLFSLPYRLLGGSPRPRATPVEVKWTTTSPRSAVAPRLVEKYKFLDYAIQNWLLHTKDLPFIGREENYYNKKSNNNEEIVDCLQLLELNVHATWARFTELALERVMAFDHLLWTSKSNHKDLPFDTMFRWALDNAHVPLLNLLEVPPRGPPLNVYLQSYLQNGQDILRTPCIKGEIKILNYLVHNCHENKMETTKVFHKEHLSWCASLNGHTPIVKLLLKEGAKVNAQTERPHYAQKIHGFPYATAIQLAVLNGHSEVVDLLLMNGASIDQINSHGLQPLLYAPNAEIVGLLLRKGADVNAKVPDHYCKEYKIFWDGSEYQMVPTHAAAGETRLMSAASNGDSDIVKLLCDQGASTDVIDGQGQTALHKACIAGHVETVRVLLAHTCQQINNKDLRFMTPLDYAVKYRHLDVGYVLLHAGADTKDLNVLALPKAAEIEDIKMVELLLDLGVSVNSFDHEGKTALQYAVEHNYVSIVQLLIERQAMVNLHSHINAFRPTLLITASATGYVEIVKILLKAGADCDSVDYNKRTALFHAVKSHHYDIARLLITHSAHQRKIAYPGRVLPSEVIRGWQATLVILKCRGGKSDCELYEFLESYMQ